MEKFKCNDCQHEFNGSEYTTECPNCSSNNIITQSKGGGIIEKFFKFIKKHKFILIGFLLLVIALLIFSGEKKPDNPQQKLKLIFPNGVVNNNHYQIMLKDETSGRVIPLKNPKKYGITFNAKNLDEQIIIIKNGIIAPCFDEEKENITISWKINKKNKKNFTGNTLNFPNRTMTFNNKSKQNYSKAECFYIPKIEVYQNLKNCNIEIKCDNWNENIKISINGKKGEYKNRKIWEYNPEIMIPGEKIDVWYYVEKHKDFTLGNNIQSIYECEPPKALTDEERENIENTIRIAFSNLCEQKDNDALTFCSPLERFSPAFDINSNIYDINIQNKQSYDVTLTISALTEFRKGNKIKLKVKEIIWDKWKQSIKKIIISDK